MVFSMATMSIWILSLIGFFVGPSIAASGPLCYSEGDCYQPGFNFDNKTCNSTQLGQLKAASYFIRDMLRAAQFNLDSDDKSIFNAFFFPEDRSTLKRGLNTLQTIVRKQGAAWDMRCGGGQGDCALQSGWLEFNFNDEGRINDVTPITFCDAYFTRAIAFDVCDSRTLIIWKDHVTIMLHEILHTEYMTGPNFHSLKDLFAPEARHALQLRSGGRDSKYAQRGWYPIESVVNWQWFIRYAYTAIQQKDKCPQNYPVWGAFDNYASADEGGKQELRKLLWSPQNETETETGTGTGSDIIDAVNGTTTTPGSSGGCGDNCTINELGP